MTRTIVLAAAVFCVAGGLTATVLAQQTAGTLTVFTITPNAPTGERVLKLFTDLRAGAGASGR